MPATGLVKLLVAHVAVVDDVFDVGGLAVVLDGCY